jgi:hypothetical protein
VQHPVQLCNYGNFEPLVFSGDNNFYTSIKKKKKIVFQTIMVTVHFQTPTEQSPLIHTVIIIHTTEISSLNFEMDDFDICHFLHVYLS